MIKGLNLLLVFSVIGILVIGNVGCRKKDDVQGSSESQPASVAQAAPETHTHTPVLPTDSALEVKWLTDFAAAKTKAAAEGKDILINFSGSDWCGWCIKLDEEVLSKDYFKINAPKYFVLVNADFPNDKSKISPETQKQNEALMKEFGIQGFPTVLLLDAEGKPYVGTGYQDGGPEKYIQHLMQLRAENGVSSN